MLVQKCSHTWKEQEYRLRDPSQMHQCNSDASEPQVDYLIASVLEIPPYGCDIIKKRNFSLKSQWLFSVVTWRLKPFLLGSWPVLEDWQCYCPLNPLCPLSDSTLDTAPDPEYLGSQSGQVGLLTGMGTVSYLVNCWHS